MMSGCDKGFEVRDYFIECERRAKNPLAALNDPAAMRSLLLTYTEKYFPDANHVVEWIIKNQFGRRNLALYDRTKLALRLEEVFKLRAKENLIASGEHFGKGCIKSDNPIEPIDTLKEVSKLAGVGRDTVAHVKVIEAKATPEQKAALSAKETTVNAVYREIKGAGKKKAELNPSVSCYCVTHRYLSSSGESGASVSRTALSASRMIRSSISL